MFLRKENLLQNSYILTKDGRFQQVPTLTPTPGQCSDSDSDSDFMKIEIKLSIQSAFASGTRLMGIVRIHLMIS